MTSDYEMLIRAKEIISNERTLNPLIDTTSIASKLQIQLKIPKWKALNIIRLLINEYG